MRSSTNAVAFAVGRALGGLPVERFLCVGKRKGTLSLARMITAYICRAEFGWSYPEIARECAYRDSSSPIDAVKRVAAMIEACDERVLRAVEAGEKAAAEYTSAPTRHVPVLASGARDVRLRKGEAVTIELDLDGMIGAPTRIEVAAE